MFSGIGGVLREAIAGDTSRHRGVNCCGHRRTGQHPFGGSNRVLPEWRTQLVCHAAPPGRKK